MCFAGLWAQWTSVWKLKDGEIVDDLYGVLTTEPNATVAPVHLKAMPVILTTAEEREAWMRARGRGAGAAAAAEGQQARGGGDGKAIGRVTSANHRAIL